MLDRISVLLCGEVVMVCRLVLCCCRCVSGKEEMMFKRVFFDVGVGVIVCDCIVSSRVCIGLCMIDVVDCVVSWCDSV